ncbi:BatD family protein [Methylomarinum sp. Ch1-1]|uniref:BatD family protein n=1 Tax=Methylomarinum roseum TaxID=3067653 RepID=A0AAU7NWC8_9GAMM|nr:BatD family protein [Methylomarinum sp. Ch1-1]MDP4522681.1 BatD family protein [Methylomarinum sp. Ch1-1]
MVTIQTLAAWLKYGSAIVLLTLLFTPLTQAANIEVAVDRNPVSISDSFQLTFTARESPDDDPDFSTLRQDFDILNQRQSSQSSWVNGRFSKTIQWTLDVMAKRTGRLLIPSIAFGDDATEPLTITVMQAPALNNRDDELFLEVETTPEQAYVQSQIIYTLRFYRRVQITQASLSEPELDDAVVEKLTEDSNYNTRINGVSYAVTERKYAIFPQQSGRLTIPPLTLTAEVVSGSRSRFNGFFSSQVTRTKRVSSRAVTLDVLPAADSYTADHWLPAEQLHLEQKWSNDNLRFQVGEPLTRTLTILAKGTTVGQLPELATPSDDAQLKTYPDQPVLKEQKNATGLIAFREEKIAFIPSSAGTFELPAIEVPWFNTESQQMEIARIPPVTLTAVAGTPAAKPTPPAAPASPSTQPTETTVQPTSAGDHFWRWLALFLGSGWLVTLAFLLHRHFRKPKSQDVPLVDSEHKRLKDSIKRLKAACQVNDAQGAKQALMEWGKMQYHSASLGAIAPHCEARLRDEILHLNQCLYAADQNAWEGKPLFQAFAEHNAREQIKRPVDEALEPLYRI